MRKRRQMFVLALLLVIVILWFSSRMGFWQLPSNLSRESLTGLPYIGEFMSYFLAGWLLFRFVRVSSKGVSGSSRARTRAEDGGSNATLRIWPGSLLGPPSRDRPTDELPAVLVPVDKISATVLFRSVRTSPRISFPGDHQKQGNGGGCDCRGRREWRHTTLMYASRCAEDVDSPNQRGGGQRGRAAMTSPSGSQINPVIAARAASGIAIATRGTATIFAGTLVSETVPNVGSSIGSVASWAATVAVRQHLTAKSDPSPIKPVRTSTRAREAATESRNPSDSICRGSTTTIAPAARRIKVT